MKTVLVILLALAVPGYTAGPVRAKTTAQKPDREIEQTIRAKLAKSKIAEDNFTVRVQSGVAILEGNTNVIQHKGVATRLAKSSGAASVDNRIRVSAEARRRSAEKLAEGRRRKAERTEQRSQVQRPAAPVQRPAAVKAQTQVSKPAALSPARSVLAAPVQAAPVHVAPVQAAPAVRRAQIKH